jgi:bacterioferritin
MTSELNITREKMIQLLNEDLAGEHQAIIASTVSNPVLKGAAYAAMPRQLEVHAGEELAHAIKIAKQIDYLGGMPECCPKRSKRRPTRWGCCAPVWRTNGRRWDVNRERIRQTGAMGEFALSKALRAIIVQKQDHEIDLAAAPGIDVPPAITPPEQKNGRTQIQDTYAPRR